MEKKSVFTIFLGLALFAVILIFGFGRQIQTNSQISLAALTRKTITSNSTIIAVDTDGGLNRGTPGACLQIIPPPGGDTSNLIGIDMSSNPIEAEFLVASPGGGHTIIYAPVAVFPDSAIIGDTRTLPELSSGSGPLHIEMIAGSNGCQSIPASVQSVSSGQWSYSWGFFTAPPGVNVSPVAYFSGNALKVP